jgi:predicted amidohydrolase YtcJ
MEAVHIDDRPWETLRWPGQWSKMLFHPRPERATEPNAGLTDIDEMGTELGALASYRRLLERGEFSFRNYVAVAGRSKSTWEHYRERGPERLGDGRLAIGALKRMADGALGSRGAALHEPYCDDPGNTGLVLMDGPEVERLTL